MSPREAKFFTQDHTANKLQSQTLIQITLGFRIYGAPLVAQTERIFLQCRRPGFDLWVEKIPWRREWQLTPVFLPGEFHGLRSLMGYSPWGCSESGTIEQLHFKIMCFYSQCHAVSLFLSVKKGDTIQLIVIIQKVFMATK